MKPKIFLISRPPARPEWGLSHARGRRLVMLGWRTPEQDKEGGVPLVVATVLARALASISQVSFFCSNAGKLAGSADEIRTIEPPGVLEKIAARFSRTELTLVLATTRNPGVVVEAFDDGGYPWWLQGQLLLLTRPDSSALELGWAPAKTLLEGDLSNLEAMVGQRLLGAVVPGVDGDVAGLVSIAAEFETAALQAIEREARHEAVEWLVVRDEESFAEGLAKRD